MKSIRVLLACTAAGVMLSACTQGATGPPSTTSVNPLGTSKLQLAVGTANFGGVHGLNVVSTLRQPNGDSAVLVDTPTLTGPFTLPAASTAGGGVDPYSTLYGGPSAQEVAVGGIISGTPQTVRPGTPVCDSATPCGPVPPNTTTLGQSGGVFGLGLAPFNSTNSGVSATYTPYLAPMFDTTGNAFNPWGGPPGFDPNSDGMGTRDGTFNLAQLLGVAEGITIFEHVTPSTGVYTLSVVIPTSPTSTGTIQTTATLSSAAFLATPAMPAAALDGSGGGTFTVTFPAGVTEGYIEILDLGPAGDGMSTNCQGPIGTAAGAGLGFPAPVFFTIHVTSPGAAKLPDTNGPNLNTSGGPGAKQPSPSIRTAAQNAAAVGAGTPGDVFEAFFVGMDYPLYAASYPQSLGNQTPVLAGANGQADITVSAPLVAQSLDNGRMRLLSRAAIRRWNMRHLR